jgi:hypothetical protein
MHNETVSITVTDVYHRATDDNGAIFWYDVTFSDGTKHGYVDHYAIRLLTPETGGSLDIDNKENQQNPYVIALRAYLNEPCNGHTVACDYWDQHDQNVEGDHRNCTH